jgi:hypothetical protein
VRPFWLSLAGILASRILSATAIVAAIFPNAVYIAADSRLTVSSNTGAQGASHENSEGCKIVQTPAAVFAVAALESDSKTGFDFGSIAKDALAHSQGSLSMRVDLVERALAPKMQQAVEGIRQDFPDIYDALQMGYLGQAVFAGWENDHPVLIEDDWKITTDGAIKQDRFPANEEMNLVILGSGGDAILRYVSENPDWWKSPTPQALAQLIRAAIKDADSTQTHDVGGDVSVLQIDSHGQRWVSPGRCPG